MALFTVAIAEFGFGGTYETVAVAPPPGRSDGLLQPRPALNRRNFAVAAAQSYELGDTHTDVTPATGPGATGAVTAVGLIEYAGNTGDHWFETIHVYPGSVADNADFLERFKIEVGNILAATTRDFELYNAYRRTPSTLTGVTNNITPGTSLPDVSPPVVLGPQTSLLDPTSPINTVSGSLGTKVRDSVLIAREGLTLFDGLIVFNFSTGETPYIDLSGQRISLITAPRFEEPFDEFLEFATDVLNAAAGKEQRIAPRDLAREAYSIRYRVDGIERQKLQALLFDWQDKIVGLPLWEYELELTVAASAGATQFQTVGASAADFRVGGLVFVYKNGTTLEAMTITAVSDTLIEVAEESQNDYAVGDKIMPLRVGQIRNVPSGRRWNVLLEEFDLLISFVDNHIGEPAASSSAWNSATHNGRPVLDECNVMVGDAKVESWQRKVVILDNVSGVPFQSSVWDRSKRQTTKVFTARSFSQIANLRAFLRWARGRQRSFYLPTKIEDLTAGADIAVATAILDIVKIDYVRFIASRDPKKRFRITYSNGTSEEKVIQSSASHPSDATLERLTLTTTWGANHAVADIVRIEFLELVRFDTDRFRIRHLRPGLASLTAPVTVVFDDDA